VNGVVSYQRRIAWWGIAFAAPALAFLLLFNITPMIRALYLSFTDYRMGAEASFIGLDNYVRVLGGSSFRNALRVSVVYVFGTVIPVWFISFTLAYLLYRVPRAQGLWRTLLFLPTVMPLLTVTLVWKLFFNYRGVINTILSPLLAEPIPWLTTAAWAPMALIITSWWHAASYYMILFLAGLQAIPTVYDEAAQLNGANGRQRLWYVTLPLMRPTIALVFVLSIIKGFRTFALQHVMTGGGPGTATEIVTLLIYKTAFNFGKFGEAAAISLLYFLVILAFSLLQLRLLRGNRGVE
jgi:ABC-type sugar transport system permease subunit